MAYPDPVFVGGTGGSGGPGVGRLVGAHSRYAEVPVPARFHAVRSGLPAFLARTTSAQQIARRMRTVWWHRTDEAGRPLGLDTLVDDETLDAALERFERDARDDRLRAATTLVRAVLDPVAERERKPSWVESTASNATAAGALSGMFPRMRLIHCLRDGRDVAADVVRQDERFDFDAALDWWVERVRDIDAAIARLPAGRALVLRVEDLAVRHTEAAWRRLLEFLVLDEEPAMTEILEHELDGLRAGIGAWREGRSANEAERISTGYEERLVRLADAGAWWAPELADGVSEEPLATRSRHGARPEMNGRVVLGITRSYDGRVTLPYALDEVPGAEHLLVTFAGLTLEAVGPPVEMRKRVGALRAHRLFIGADHDFYFGPKQTLAGAETAVELIRREAWRLDVEPRNVITYGVSAASLAALYIGLKARAGRIFAGAPPIRAAGWVRRLDRAVAPSADVAGMRRELVERTEIDSDPDAALFYDRFIWRAAQRATHEASIHLFASFDDLVVRDAEWFHDVLRDHPTLTCHLEIQDYGAHSWAKLPFFGYMQRNLLPELGSYS